MFGMLLTSPAKISAAILKFLLCLCVHGRHRKLSFFMCSCLPVKKLTSG